MKESRSYWGFWVAGHVTWVDNFRVVFDFGSRLAQIHLHRKKFVKGVGKNVRSQSCCNLQSRGTRMLVCSTNDNLTHFWFLIFQIAYHCRWGTQHLWYTALQLARWTRSLDHVPLGRLDSLPRFAAALRYARYSALTDACYTLSFHPLPVSRVMFGTNCLCSTHGAFATVSTHLGVQLFRSLS